MARVLSTRDAAVWATCFLAVSVTLVATGFASDDPDSALYANLSARLAEGPVANWIAPEWWGNWNSEGWFREHPAGVFVLPTALASLGVPGVQASYIVGIGAGLASLLLIAHLVAGVTSRADARAVLILLQLMPLASIFRIRANHEYPMLVCLLVALVGADLVRRSWVWVWVTPLALVAGLMVKGVFVVVPIIALGAWILLNPRREPGSWLRPATAFAIGLVAMAAVALVYDVAYQRVTGERFWGPYWARQLEPLTIATPGDGGSTLAGHLAFYAIRVLWHPAPWSLALMAAAWANRSRLRAVWADAAAGERRGALFALLTAASIIFMLVPASRFAERYIFAANYLIATAGIVVACRAWPSLARTIDGWDRRVPALPPLVWLGLMAARLVIGPFLPRISG